VCDKRARRHSVRRNALRPASRGHAYCALPATGYTSPINGRDSTMKAPVIAIMLSLSLCAPALAATFVYVSNADDGTIGTYTLQGDGTLKAGDRVEAAKVVMPMAVAPDKRFLIAAVRSKPYEAY